MTLILRGTRAVALSLAVALLPPAAAEALPSTPTADAEQLPAVLPPIMPLRDQARLRDTWLAQRLDTVVPALMREQGIDMWVLVAREYLEDPVVATMLDAESMRARRRTILIFFDPGGGQGVQRLTVSRYGMGGLFQPAWRPEEEPDQFRRLAAIITEKNPRRIALNVSENSAFADGLTKSQHDSVLAALPAGYAKRVVSGEELAIGWLEARSAAEMETYPTIVRTAHAIIGEGFSRHVITPGRTTAADLVWWFRERIAALKLSTWFQPSVGIFRKGAAGELSGDTVIQPGDMLWTDFGIMHLGLATDTQHLAYVLKPGERDAPPGLRAGLANANRVQDSLATSFAVGLSGNQMLERARAKATALGLEPSIYSHPIGFHGHGAGAAIGFWDDQKPSPRGERRLRANTAWSIELSQTQAVPEWGGQRIPFRLEEDAYFDGTSLTYLDGRQKAFHLIETTR
ncbi:M24 family metallopeptidase [Sphingosinicella sp. BN140058]|uniref:M24 family metallopeptidase n=1 Tax=Sphingosinicella sp. BN140058 TaxID=1892855 RepID=UPI001011BDD1|nr:M24 family metallopeptidase [Sphingosinicella sp. BN140058]QAY78789.1 aminopeptidase P family protein [Sphingosinicella sp. BN140058]